VSDTPFIPPTVSDRASDPEGTDLHFSAMSADSSGVTCAVDATVLPANKPVPAAPQPPPAAVGRYTVSREIAHGGMGAILAGRDPDLGRDVAIKVLLANHLGKPGYRERFVEEARITASLQHPGVVAVYDVGDLPDARPFFAMQLVDGATLDAQLAARKNPAENLPHFLAVFERVCQAMAYAHSRGVIHRDLKPLNVMVAPFGVVKVMDWGVAKVLGGPDVAPVARHVAADPTDPTAGDTAFGSVIGTPAFMSPEQAQGDNGRVDERTDVFGLGGILCVLFTGQPPYPGARTRKVYARARRADLADAFARLDASPAARELVALAKRCLAPHREARPRNAQQVAAALTAYIESDLRRAERDLVRFFELSPDLFCIAGMDGYFRRVNENFTRVLGYTPAELTGRPFVDFVHPDDRASTRVETEKLARGLPVVQFKNRYRDNRGGYRWFEWEAKSIPEEGVIFAVARDITARVELEGKLGDGKEGPDLRLE
jgi:eukaryotic-like serine/threonine-protein kinase